MSVTYGRIKNWSAGDTLTAVDLNAEFDNILNNTDPASVGAQTVDATLTAIAALTLSQGMLLTATGADAPAVLAKGAANTKLFTNAGATAPEWSVGYKIGAFEREMDAVNGNVAYTGVGFKPSKIVFIAGHDTSGNEFSIGFDNGTAHYSVAQVTAGNFYASISYSILLYEDASHYQSASVASLDTDGFTLTWAKTADPAHAHVVVSYLAIR